MLDLHDRGAVESDEAKRKGALFEHRSDSGEDLRVKLMHLLQAAGWSDDPLNDEVREVREAWCR